MERWIPFFRRLLKPLTTESTLMVSNVIVVLSTTQILMVRVNLALSADGIQAVVTSHALVIARVYSNQISTETVDLPRLVKQEVKHPVLVENFLFHHWHGNCIIFDLKRSSNLYWMLDDSWLILDVPVNLR